MNRLLNLGSFHIPFNCTKRKVLSLLPLTGNGNFELLESFQPEKFAKKLKVPFFSDIFISPFFSTEQKITQIKKLRNHHERETFQTGDQTVKPNPAQ